MIRNFSDHAANERTFLAWVRTALAIAAFGVAASRLGLVGHGLSVITGVGLVSIASVILIGASYRFIRLSHQLHDEDTEVQIGVKFELLLALLLVLFVITFGFLLWSASGA